MTPQRPASPFLLERHLYGATGLALLIALYLLPGTLGHTPWRGDDVESFATVQALLRGEWFLFPHMAGMPVTEYGPLHYWLSGAFALLGGWLLPLHDAARLATPLAAILATFWIARTASRLYGRHTRAAAALLTIGTMGLALHIHENQPMVTLMATQALTLAGLSLVPARPLQGSLQAALGIVLAFLTAGPLGMLLTIPLMLVVAIGAPECRTPRASGALILGLSLAIGGCALWVLVLSLNSPQLLDLWWRLAWGSFVADPLPATDVPRVIELIGWTVWPLWPIALWALWKARRQVRQLPWLLPIVGIVLAAIWIYANSRTHSANMLPLLPPLTLLAAAGVQTLRRGAANAFDWFAVMGCAMFALMIWLAWSAQVFEWPPGLARSLARMAPDFSLSGTAWQAALGALIILVWAGLVWRLPRTADRSSINWAMGLTMLWCLTVALLLPWVDHTRNYRPMAESLAATLADQQALCVATLGLSNSHRAALDIHTGLRPVQARPNDTTCRFLIVADDDVIPDARLSAQWQPIWEYQHAGGRRLEVFRLYRRD